MRRIACLRFALLACGVGWGYEALAACTGSVTIAEFYPRDGGWVHVLAAGVPNMDLFGCGNTGPFGLLLNFNDTGGSVEGKKLLWSTLLTAHASGKRLMLCSSRCDSQYPGYSSLTHIDSAL
jgi:hypothetical protein